jgi:signal transduction histidine kinase
MNLLDIVHPEDRSLICEQGMVRDVDRELPKVFTVRLVKKDGQSMHAESSAKTITYHDRRAMLGVCRDISDIKKQDEERIRVQRLESMSTVVDGIAHDFNNFLTVILGNISLARMMVEPDSGIHEMLSDSEMVAASASKLTEQLLAFSRREQPVKSELRFTDFLEEAVNLGPIGADITTDVRISDDIWSIRADHAQIAQVIRNIVVNAVQAMPGGGTVKLRASNFVAGLDGREPLEPGLYVRIEVDDSGPGIPEEILPRIFDPLFTTKRSSAGLGLPTAHSIVERHGGRIRADNLPDGGCRFTVFLPTDRAAADGDAPRLADLAVSGGRILVMDDKAMVRSTVAVMLEHLGYEVETAGDGREAIALYKRSMDDGRRFDAVILDLTVQNGMGGKETIVELRRLDPHVRAVLSSGYSSDPFVTGYRQHGFSGVVVKPYSLAKLASTIRGITRN